MSQKAFGNVENAVEYLLGSDISETMAAIPPDVDELTDEDKVDKKTWMLDAFCDKSRAAASILFPWRAALLIF